MYFLQFIGHRGSFLPLGIVLVAVAFALAYLMQKPKKKQFRPRRRGKSALEIRINK